jgi:predicted GH43/DUF377 family glycosyl hydrolase
MIKIENRGIVLEKTALEFENQAVLNPACIEKDGIIHMFYRAVKTGNFSTIGYCQFKDGKLIYRKTSPVLVPEHDYEKHGLEDPRIVLLDGIYHLFYVAYDGKNARVALATSTNLVNFKKQGVITSQMSYDKAEDLFKKSKVSKFYTFFERLYRKYNTDKVILWEKDAFIFPEKINGKFALIHRVLPGIQVAYFDSFKELNNKFWSNYFTHLKDFIILEPKFEFENSYIGGGCPPIRIKEGWLFIYHAVEEKNKVKTYHAGAALLDINNPTKVIGRLNHPLFTPTENWEKQGDVNNVVFPTSAILNGNKIDIYYGAADSVIAVKTVDLDSLLNELLNK